MAGKSKKGKELKFDLEGYEKGDSKPDDVQEIKPEKDKKDDVKKALNDIKDDLKSGDEKEKPKKKETRGRKPKVDKTAEYEEKIQMFCPVVTNLSNIIFVRLKWDELTEIEEKQLSKAVFDVGIKWAPWLFEKFTEEMTLIFVVGTICMSRSQLLQKLIDLIQMLFLRILMGKDVINVKEDENHDDTEQQVDNKS